MTLKELMLYRSALSADDVESLAAGELQKGSLEIYSTFSRPEAGTLAEEPAPVEVENYAMSLNALRQTKKPIMGLGDIENELKYTDTEYYTIEGIATRFPVRGNLYIAVTGSTAKKVIY